KGNIQNLLTHSLISIQLDSTVTDEQVREGLSREIIRRVQMARKNAQLNLDDRIRLQIKCTGALKEAAKAHQQSIQSEVLATQIEFVEGQLSHKSQEDTDIDGDPLSIAFEVT